jgi:hypothetical protein
MAAADAGGDAPTGGGSCSANVPKGQACNAITNVGTPVTPTCNPAAVPAGTGGTIVDGTYTLTSQTYYGSATCETNPLTATLEIAGGCIQEVSTFDRPVTVSTAATVSGANITLTVNCVDLGTDAGQPSFDVMTNTFTATPTTFTLFIKNSGTTSPNPDRVETYQKR